MLPTTPMDAIQSISETRLELSRSDFGAAMRIATDGLGRDDLNEVQRERLLLLRAEASHALQDFERALRDATAADRVADGQSPQAQFIRGRELFALGRLQEAKDAFDMAEVLMLTPTPLRYTSPDGRPISPRVSWANVGVAPQDIPNDATTPPPTTEAHNDTRLVSYDWVQDLAKWRAVRDECNSALDVSQTRLVPRTVIGITQKLMERRLITKSSRYLVLFVRNDTTESLIFDFHKFKEGQFLEGCSFPHIIPPMSTAIGAAHSNSWLGGVKGTVSFKLHSHSLLFSFDCPLTAGFSSRALIVPRLHLLPSGSLAPNARPSTVAKILNSFVRVSTSPPSYVQHFSVCMRNDVSLSAADVLSILDFLPAHALRKASAVTRQWRQMCGALPPARFYGLSRPFPDYRSESDLEQTCWTVRDRDDVKWFIRTEPTFNDERLISFVDSNEQKIFFLQCDIFARATSTVLYYGTKLSPLISFEESFFRATRKTTAKLGGRPLFTLQYDGVTVEMSFSTQTAPVWLTLDRVTETLHVIRDRRGREHAKVLLVSRAARKGPTVAELLMHHGADALLCCSVTFFALFRLA